VAWIAHANFQLGVPNNTPQQRTWAGLTGEDYKEIFEKARSGEHAVQLAEEQLKKNNT
jgi:hypothetical protein